MQTDDFWVNKENIPIIHTRDFINEISWLQEQQLIMFAKTNAKYSSKHWQIAPLVAGPY